MSTEAGQNGEKETLGRSALGHGRLNQGKWYCECDREAKYMTAKKSGSNKGRKFWRCPKKEDEQCPFFLWVDNEEEAKSWLKMSQVPPSAKAPIKMRLNQDGLEPLPQLLETPFTKAKRKHAVRDVGDSGNNDEDGGQAAKFNEDSLQPAALELRQPSEKMRKTLRTSTISTPGQNFVERLQHSRLPLPTPDSGDHLSSTKTITFQPRLPPNRDLSPTPGRFNDATALNSLGSSDLTETVLELVRAEHPGLKASTELQLRHEIGLTQDLSETKLRRYEETISELRKKVDELETMVFHLT